MDSIRESAFTKVAMLSRRITQVYNAALQPYGITAAQYVLLSELAAGSMAHVIGASLGIEKSTMSRNLQRLEKLGAIMRQPPQGRHGRSVELTAKGRQLLVVSAEPWRAAELSVASNVGDLMKVGFLAPAA